MKILIGLRRLLSMSCSFHQFVRLVRLTNCLSIMAASSKFITDAIKYCTSDLLDSQDQSSIIHNYFSSIILVIMLMF